MRHATLLIAVFSAALLLLAGCGGNQEQSAPAPTTGGQETTMAETTMETTSQMETTASEAPAGGDQYGQQTGDDCLERQFSQATQGMNPQQAGDYETGVIDEAVNRQMDPRDVIAERGFPC